MLIRRATTTNWATLPVVVILATFGMVHIATVAPFLNEMADDFEVSKGLMGQLNTVTCLASMLAAVSIVPFIGRLPLRPVLVLGTLGLGATSVLTGLVPWFAGLLAVRFAAGIGAALVIGGCWAAVGRAWPDPAARAKSLGFVLAGLAGGSGLIAPVLRIVAGSTSWQFALVAAGAFMAAVGIVGWVALPEMAGRPDRVSLALRERLLAGARVPRLPVIGPVLLLRLTSAVMLNCLFVYMAGFVVDEYANADHWIGPVFAGGSLAFALAAVLSGPMMPRLGGSMRMSELGIVAQCGVLAAFAWVTPSPAVTMLLFVVWGVVAGLYFNGLIGMLYEYSGRAQSNVMFADSAVGQLGGVVGTAIGGVAVGAMTGFMGWQFCVVAMSVVVLLQLPFVRRAARRQAARSGTR